MKSSLFVKLFMSEEARGKWLASPIRFINDYDDWRQMNPTAAREHECLSQSPEAEDFMSVSEFLDNIADISRHFKSWYDEDEGAFFIAGAEHKSAVSDIAATVAALRGAEKFADAGKPGFLYVFPALSGGDPDVLMKIKNGESRFLSPSDTSPEILYFVNEAEEFMEEMLEE